MDFTILKYRFSITAPHPLFILTKKFYFQGTLKCTLDVKSNDRTEITKIRIMKEPRTYLKLF